MTRRALLAGAVVPSMLDAAPRISAPLFARLFDEAAGRLSVIHGLPGSLVSTLAGEPPPKVLAASAAKQYLVHLDSQAQSALWTFDGAAVPLPLLPPSPPPSQQRVVLSEEGDAAAFEYEAGTWLASGLPDAPRLRPAEPGGQTLAVSGAKLLVQDLAALWLVEGPARTQLLDSGPVQVAFTRSGVAAATADAVRHWDARTATWVTLLTREQGLREPLALAADGDALLVADREAGCVFELRSGGVARHDCYQAPSRLMPLGGRRFLLNGFSEPSVLVLSLSPGERGIATVARGGA